MCECDFEKILKERDTVLTREYDAALDFADFACGDTILDVATGSGRMLLQLLKRGYAVVSGDVDPQALDRARERLGDLADKPTLVVFDAHKLQFDDASFQAVTFANAIHEIADPRSALDEITRVLTGDGKLLVVEFNACGFELMELHHKLLGKEMHPRGKMGSNEIDRYLRQSFSCVETGEFSITHAWVASGKKRGKNR